MTTTNPAFTAQRDQILAELDVGDAPMPPCPAWCRLRPGHGWDSIHDDGSRSRGHAGPSFGEYVSVGSGEHEDGTVYDFGIDVVVESGETGSLTANLARKFASSLVAAAEWMEAHS